MCFFFTKWQPFICISNEWDFRSHLIYGPFASQPLLTTQIKTSPDLGSPFNFSAVATHKYVISFCVGLELLTARTPFKLFAFYISVFSLVSPLGVAVGIRYCKNLNNRTTAVFKRSWMVQTWTNT